jgi:hypothetical protein
LDGSRFDELTRQLAERSSRRQALKGLAGTVLAMIGFGAIGRSASAAPAVSLSVSSGPVRTRAKASLSGFKRLEAFEIRWYTGNSFQVVATGAVTRGGARSITFTVPNTPRGTHTVRAAGAAGSVANTSFVVKQSITLSEEVGAPGASIKATLRGYKARAQVQLRFFPTSSAGSTLAILGSTTVSSTGTGTITFTIPGNAATTNHRVEGRETVSGVLATTAIKVKCASATDCPGVDTECKHRTCVNGSCGIAFTAANTAVSQQTAGDCRKKVCNGSGNLTDIVDNTDLPTDANECTDDICTSGVPSHPARQAGTSCSQNGGAVCDGFGNCLACVPGSTVACYTGPTGTEDVGICAGGTATCDQSGSGYGPCIGEVTPGVELTCNGADDDCDGTVDNGVCDNVPNGTSSCVEGECQIVACDTGYRDCNGTYSDGCETSVTQNNSHCGDCDIVCPQGSSCVDEVCKKPQGAVCSSPAECQTGFCADGFCCNEACDEVCVSCEGTLFAGTNGVCTNVPTGADPFNECPGNRVCGGARACTA